MDGDAGGGENGGEVARTVSPEEARRMLATNEASAIDIRDDEKWREGRLPAARHCADGDFSDALDRIAEDQTVIVACEDGDESARVADRIREQGREAVGLEGGMEAWRSDDQPMQPSTDPEEGAKI